MAITILKGNKMTLSQKLSQRLQNTKQVDSQIIEIKEAHLDLISGAGAHGSAHGSGHASGHASIGQKGRN